MEGHVIVDALWLQSIQSRERHIMKHIDSYKIQLPLKKMGINEEALDYGALPALVGEL